MKNDRLFLLEKRAEGVKKWNETNGWISEVIAKKE